MAVHYRDASGSPVIVPVEAAERHPLYRPDAIKARVQSIDVALVRTAKPLDPRFVGATLASGEGPSVGETVVLSGYGITREGDWKSGGTLRSVALAVSPPASTVLIWAAAPDGGIAGACAGDSGAPIWSADGRDGRRHRGLGAGAARPRLRRPHPRPAARAAQDAGSRRRSGSCAANNGPRLRPRHARWSRVALKNVSGAVMPTAC